LGTGDNRKAPPLIAHHEIVSSPSASVMAVLRQETAGRRPAEKAVAILADPVFSADDARIAQSKDKTTIKFAAGDTTANENQRSSATLGVQDFVRLRFSRNEADEIERLAPVGAALKALDFEASRDTALDPRLGRYRIVHFATHSLLNNERPELSGVVLSLFDRSGHPVNGFLRLYDIYNLRLGSDLVVLSACQTALGGEIKGEGLIGLTRGFIYAGASSVIASLWKVDDRATTKLMTEFYKGLFEEGLTTSAALRQAKIKMWRQSRYREPFYWAAFVLQGEWK